MKRNYEALRAWRLAAKLTFQQVAVAGGVCVRTVQRWEDGTVSPRMSEIGLIEGEYPGFLKACCKAFV